MLKFKCVRRVHAFATSSVTIPAQEHVISYLGVTMVVTRTVCRVCNVWTWLLLLLLLLLLVRAVWEVEVVPVLCVVGVVDHGAGTAGKAGVHVLGCVGHVFDFVACVEGVAERDRGLFGVVDGWVAGKNLAV